MTATLGNYVTVDTRRETELSPDKTKLRISRYVEDSWLARTMRRYEASW